MSRKGEQSLFFRLFFAVFVEVRTLQCPWLCPVRAEDAVTPRAEHQAPHRGAGLWCCCKELAAATHCSSQWLHGQRGLAAGSAPQGHPPEMSESRFGFSHGLSMYACTGTLLLVSDCALLKWKLFWSSCPLIHNKVWNTSYRNSVLTETFWMWCSQFWIETKQRKFHRTR